MLGVFKARLLYAWTGGAGRGAAQLELGRERHSPKNGGTPPARQREGTGQPALLHTNRGSTRGRERTRAPGYSAPRSGRLQEWSAANDAER